MQQYPFLKHLELRQASLNCEALKIISEGITEDSSLISLDISQNHFKEKGFKTLIKKLKKSKIEVLELEEFDLSDENLWTLLDFFKNGNNKLRVFGLSGTEFTEANFNLLVE